MILKIDIINVRKVRNSSKGGHCMELAKVTSKGQITIPIEIRKKLGIKAGSKVLFWKKQDGYIWRIPLWKH